MKNKKAIFFDIDGTLISGKIGIPDSTINVLTELSNNPNFDLYISFKRIYLASMNGTKSDRIFILSTNDFSLMDILFGNVIVSGITSIRFLR